MENRDKIFDQFKNAAQNVAPKEFASMESVWNRVEEKLDKRVLKKETKNWRKIAIAASIFLCVSIGYQFFKTENEMIIPENNVVTNKKLKVLIEDKVQELELEISKQTPEMNANVDKMIQKASKTEEVIAYNEPNAIVSASSMPKVAEAMQASPVYDKVVDDVDDVVAMKKESSNSKAHFFRTKIYDARGVKQTFEEVSEQEVVAVVKQENKKQNPLYVIDGESVANNQNKDTKGKLSADNIENIVVLKEPLYIINGTEYSEESLFGSNPTSPYAPLDQQEIIKTVVFQGEEAIVLYGEKGRKGVVIVTTKNGKAVKKL